MPIPMTSGYVRPEDRAEAAERLGVLAVIAKPDTVEELGAALDRVFRLRRSHQRTAAG